MNIIKPKDVVAIVALSLLVLLAIYRVDVNIDVPIAVIIGYYFAKRSNGIDTGK